MARIAVIYGSRYGQTQKVSGRIADLARARGHEVIVIELQHPPQALSLAGMDAAFVGAPVYYGRHHKDVTRFVTDHRADLERIPSAFFSVSGSAASENAEKQIEARQCVDTFLQQTGWHPSSLAMFGGAMANSQYSWIFRMMIQFVARKSGMNIDPKRDYEYTDWVAVEHFATSFLDRLPPREPHAGARISEERHVPSA